MKKRFLIPAIIFGLIATLFIFLGSYLLYQANNIPPVENIEGALALPFVVIVEIYFSVWCYFIGAISIVISIPLIIATCKSKKK